MEANQTRQDQRRAVFYGLDIGRYQLMSRVTSHERMLDRIHHRDRQAQQPPLAAAEHNAKPTPRPWLGALQEAKARIYHTRLPAEPGVFVAYRPRNRAGARFPAHATRYWTWS